MVDIKQVLDYLETEEYLSYDFIQNIFFKWYFTFNKEEEEFKRTNFILKVWKKKNYKIAECEYDKKGINSFTIYFSPKLRACKIKYFSFCIYKYMDDLIIK